jgi:hypothetical protein
MWEYRDLLGNLGIFWVLTWDFYKITVGNADCIILTILCFRLAMSHERFDINFTAKENWYGCQNISLLRATFASNELAQAHLPLGVIFILA